MENKPLSTSSTSSKEIGWREVNGANMVQQGTIGDEVDRWIGPLPVRGYLDASKLVVDRLPEPMTKARYVALNESGTQRIGEDHARAKLTNDQVDTIRDEYEAHPPGDPQHVGYRLLAKKWGVSKRTIRDICNYEKRNQWAGRWKKLTP